MPEALGHRALCDVAVKWLQRPHSAQGHGCNFAVSECQSGFRGGEIPDAIGFRAQGWRDGTVLVEVKVSRADFYADRVKPHRISGGMGNWRYFMAPTGLIRPDDLPPRWGLIEVNKRQQVRVVAGASLTFTSFASRDSEADWRHESDMQAELSLLVRLMARVGDPEAANRRLAATNAQLASIIKRDEANRARIRELETAAWVAKAQALETTHAD